MALPGSAALIAQLMSADEAPPSAPGLLAAPGELPADGRPQVAGISLPPGRRWAPEGTPAGQLVGWCTDEVIDGAPQLAWRLAAAYRDTGLWPILWLDSQHPSIWCYLPGRTAAVDVRKAEEALSEAWSRLRGPSPATEPYGARFPGLTRHTGRISRGVGPFRLLEDYLSENTAWTGYEGQPRLLLVPCRHPGDSVAAIGLECGTVYSGVEDRALISSVLRSWEQRFAALPVAFAPRSVLLAVGAPPTDFDTALRIAAEHRAFATANDYPPLRDQAQRLLTTAVWDFGWDE